jgi:tripartite-type tricarboxylate transporter receptor subunit TctC
MDARKILVAFVAVALSVTPPFALSQTYPSKPVRFVVGFAAGGATDVAARLVAQKLAERLGQPVIVENRPGADTIIAAESVAKATPDGHTLLFLTFSTMTILPHARKSLPYDPFKDFVHVAQIAYVPYALAVNPSVPAASVAELVALARSKPGQLTYASASEGGYITAEMFKAATGTVITQVPYKGSGPATTDLLSGQVNMMFSLFASIVPYFKSQKLKPLAVTGEKRSPALPDVPTMSEAGVKGFEASSSFGISAPRATPPAVVKRLSSELAAVLQMPDLVEKMLAQGVEPRFGTPEQFTALLRAESEKYRGVLQRIGFKAE